MHTRSENFDVKVQQITIGSLAITLRTLKNQEQYYDPAGLAEAIGITESTWSSFGVIWQSAIRLAQLIESMPLSKLRILELGCGIALPGLVASKKGADIHVSDYHPLAESFLQQNSRLNDLENISYHNGDWRNPITQLGRFDLIIGSELLSAKEHPQMLSSFIHCHTKETSEVILVDSNRKHNRKFSKLMQRNGFSASEKKPSLLQALDRGYKSTIYRFLKQTS